MSDDLKAIPNFPDRVELSAVVRPAAVRPDILQMIGSEGRSAPILPAATAPTMATLVTPNVQPQQAAPSPAPQNGGEK